MSPCPNILFKKRSKTLKKQKQKNEKHPALNNL